MLFTLALMLLAVSLAFLPKNRPAPAVKEEIPSCCSKTGCPEKKNTPAKMIMDDLSRQFISTPVLSY